MHIPSYQIHNVLNVYRKQLSQAPGKSAKAPSSSTPPTTDRISISSDGQRQSIMDRISSEIVDRITQFGPETEFDAVLEDKLPRTGDEHPDTASQQDTDFSYTLIDEHNRKTTNTLPIRKLGPMIPMQGPLAGPEIENKFTPEEE